MRKRKSTPKEKPLATFEQIVQWVQATILEELCSQSGGLRTAASRIVFNISAWTREIDRREKKR